MRVATCGHIALPSHRLAHGRFSSLLYSIKFVVVVCAARTHSLYVWPCLNTRIDENTTANAQIDIGPNTSVKLKLGRRL